MKRTLSLILAVLMLLSLSSTAFAATGDIAIKHDLQCEGQHEVYVNPGDVITVHYYVSASENASVSTMQDEIFYDHEFFEVVEGSNKASEGFRDFISTLQIRLSTKHFVFFNTITSHEFTSAPAEVGTFRLKVLAEKGDSYVRNTSCMAFDINAAQFGCEVEDLHVIIKDSHYHDDSGDCKRDKFCPMYDFIDLDLYAWYHDPVHFCLENHIMYGMGNSIFEPNGSTSRAMIVTMLYNMAGEPASDYKMTYKDVNDYDWFAEPIRWATETGVVFGYSDEEFGPNDPITREQMAAILTRYCDEIRGIDISNQTDNLPFEDTDDITPYAYGYICWCYNMGIISGREGNVFEPKGLCTRAEAATFVYNLYLLFGL